MIFIFLVLHIALATEEIKTKTTQNECDMSIIDEARAL